MAPRERGLRLEAVVFATRRLDAVAAHLDRAGIFHQMVGQRLIVPAPQRRVHVHLPPTHFFKKLA